MKLETPLRRCLVGMALAGLVSVGAWAQSSTASGTTTTQPTDQQRDRRDLRRDVRDRNLDQRDINRDKKQLEASNEKYGVNSRRSRYLRRDIRRDRRDRNIDTRDIHHDRRDLRQDRRNR